MLWLVVGLFLARSVPLTLIARKLPVRAVSISRFQVKATGSLHPTSLFVRLHLFSHILRH